MAQNLNNERDIDFEDTQGKIDSESSSSSGASDDEAEYSVPEEMMGLQPYQFEPVIDVDNVENAPDDSEAESSDEEDESRLENLDW